MTAEGRQDPIEARVLEHLGRLRLTATRESLAAPLTEAAREKLTHLAFIDRLMHHEVESKQDKRVRMGKTIAHFPMVRTLEGFDFAAQPSVDERLVREPATGSFVAHGTNVLLFGAPGLGKTHLAIGLGRRLVELGHTVLFTTATGLLSVLSKAESEGRLEEKLMDRQSGPAGA